jgi:hypothetical protein
VIGVAAPVFGMSACLSVNSLVYLCVGLLMVLGIWAYKAEMTDRRTFLKSAGAAGLMAGPWLKSTVRAASPNDMVNVAVIGIRSRGAAHYKQFARLANVHVVTLRRRGRAAVREVGISRGSPHSFQIVLPATPSRSRPGRISETFCPPQLTYQYSFPLTSGPAVGSDS